MNTNKKRSKFVALFLAMIMVLTMVPGMAFAGENNAEDVPSSYGYDESAASSVKVYVTLSSDGMPLQGQDTNKTAMAKLEVDVPYFDLANYGLEEYYRYETEGGTGSYINDTVVQRPTALHLYIYMTELYYMGLDKEKCGQGTSGIKEYIDTNDVMYIDGDTAYTPDGSKTAFGIEGGPCSLYINGGFWGHDENLNYYRNHRFPLMSDNIGATADYALLSDGDVVDIALNSSWDNIFYGHFLSFNKDDYEGETGTTLTVSTMSTARTGAFGEETPILDYTDELDVAIYDANWDKVDASVTFNGDGTYSIVLPEKAGDYYILGTNLSAKTTDCVDAPAVAELTVEQAYVPVTGITLDKSEVTVEVDETETLTATVEPKDATDKTVTWTSSDEEVAVVENGKVSAKKTGEATITATAGEFKAECKVTVPEINPEKPAKDEDGFYMISTAQQLEWFRDAVNSGKTGINAKLMNDIDLSEVCGPEKGAWESIGAYYGYKQEAYFTDGVFDGQGYTVSNLYYEDATVDFKDTDFVGLFGKAVQSTIKNVTVEGKIITSHKNVAGLISNISSCIIENCHSNVDITTTGGSSLVGGITAVSRSEILKDENGSNLKDETGKYVYEQSKIINCSNSGNITTSKRGAAGIVGECFDPMEIKGCFNTGEITVADYERNACDGAAGIVAHVYFGAELVISDCYNTGTIEVTDENDPIAIGGIIGNMRGGFQNWDSYKDTKNVIMRNCYNAGKLITNKDNTAVLKGGNVGSTWENEERWVADNNYYLDSIAETDAFEAMALPEEALKNMTDNLGEGYKSDANRINKGYPILSWQNAEYVAETEVTLNETEAALWNDATLQLKATVAPKNATYRSVTWSTSDNKIATVTNKGLVKPVKGGEVIITATTESGLKAECKVTVKEVVRVVNVKLNKTELYLFNGEKEQLTATVKPSSANYKDVTWESSDRNVAIVNDEGNVRATGAGTAVITAKADGISGSCTVMVASTDTTIESVYKELPFDSITTDKGELLADIKGTTTNFAWSGGVTTYKVVIPEGTEYVEVLMPDQTKCTGSVYTYDLASNQIVYYPYPEGHEIIENEDGTLTLKIPTADYTGTNTGILFNTGWSYEFGMDFVEGVAMTPLDRYITVAKAQLEEYVDLGDYREAEAAEVEELLAAGLEAISKLESAEKINEMVASVKAAIDEVKTEAEYEAEEKALKDAKNEAKITIDSYELGDYRIAEKLEIIKISFSAKDAINDAETVEEVEAILEAAIAELDAVKTDAQLKAEAVAGATVKLTAKAASYNKVSLSWDEIEYAEKYEVSRATSKNGAYTVISVTEKTAINNTKNVKTGKTYYYKVRASVGETYSDYSVVKSAKPVLAKVKGVKAKAGKKKVTVSWKKVAGANGYKVYRYNSSTGKYKVAKTIKKGTTVKWTNTKLKKGKTYKYKVKAYRIVDGKKVYSSSYSAVVKAKAK